MLVTVLTPAYNREKELTTLYNSLKTQNCKDFEWIVVDDGSTDNTEKLIKNFIDENKIDVSYIKKDNGGKHTAVNYGVKKSKGKMIFIVDSDDYLTCDAIETIKAKYAKYKDNKTLGGFSFLRKFTDDVINGDLYPKDEFEDNYYNIRIKKNISGDKAEVYFQKAIKEFPFIEFSSERFLSEDTAWLEMAKKYNFIYINKAIYVGNYLENGLTSNDKKVKFLSPTGSAYRGLIFMRSNLPLKFKLKGAIIYNCYRIEKNCKISEFRLSFFEKILTLVTYLPGLYFHKKWSKER